MSETINDPKAAIVEYVRLRSTGEVCALSDHKTGESLAYPSALEMEALNAGTTVAELIERRHESN